MINLKEEQLRQFLQEAYKAGWYGCLELENLEIDKILEKAKTFAQPPNQQMYLPMGPRGVHGPLSGGSQEQLTIPSHINLTPTYTINAAENYTVNTSQITIADITNNSNIF